MSYLKTCLRRIKYKASDEKTKSGRRYAILRKEIKLLPHGGRIIWAQHMLRTEQRLLLMIGVEAGENICVYMCV